MSASILIVDDEAGYRDLLRRQLTRRGYSVDTAQDGAEGAAMAAAGRYGLAVVDITMPRKDGLRVLADIKEAAPGTAVILVTGFASVETAVDAMRAGAADFVLKPFDLEPFMGRVQRALEENRHGR